MKAEHSSLALEQRFVEKLGRIITGNCQDGVANGLAVAFSGGLDSTVLLDLAVRYCRQSGHPLFAFHIHHGLSPNADAWLQHCQLICDGYGVSLLAEKITVSMTGGEGVEASARAGRYRALGQLTQRVRVDLILSAHHQDDQAETLLLQLLRGSGVAGMSGMDECHRAQSLFGIDELLLARPLLAEKRKALDEYAYARNLSHIEDESNTDPRYLRNAIRHQVMPVLEKLSAGYSERLARSAIHFQSAQEVLIEVAAQDLAACSIDDGLSLSAMQALSEARRDNLFRHWFAQAGIRMPTTSRLKEMQSQLFDGRDDAKITVHHDNRAIHRYSDGVYLEHVYDKDAVQDLELRVEWHGQAAMHFPEFGGTLYFEPGDEGIAATWLQQQVLSLHLRRGGERLKLAENRPTRDMKSHFQSLRIPFWQREKLPYLSVGKDLVFAAGVGMQSRFCTSEVGQCIRLTWSFDTGK
ncbi:tRNA lysidine(34) synthetase TilS [Undibacterium sp. CY18W]|uniref:tRNA(Ile)-lysidine synthase n=1 Tax=Undibacterium hunanense TaxID=2762292 RepID=A0ABR6ZK49_9BURK|nr:tRNA lysidine(34) synthetase TilS [Undibacterium hunanense]MBC3916279.1 tRNA lysidine(34) synthetase TilS [Undibacterium hunanense]